MSKVHLVSLREPDLDGTGDARRAARIAQALDDLGVETRTSSLIDSRRGFLSAFHSWKGAGRLAAAIARWLRFRHLPLQVLMVAAAWSDRPRTRKDEVAVYVTSRVVPEVSDGPIIVDFVDSLAENVRMRRRRSLLSSIFWNEEAKRLATWEHSVSERAAASFAVSAEEATLIGPTVVPVPIDVDIPEAQFPSLGADGTLIFGGSLFYEPNAEAARWIMSKLVPELERRGFAAHDVVVAGRRPSEKLVKLARSAGVTLQADVPDLVGLMAQSAVILAPVELGSGVQTKVLNAVALGRPLIMTPRANRGLGIPSTERIRVLPRSASTWADAVEGLLGAGALPWDGTAPSLVAGHSSESVRRKWAAALLPHLQCEDVKS